VPPDVLTRLSESSPVREVARLGRAAAQRLQKDDAGLDETGAGPADEDLIATASQSDAPDEDPLS